MRYKKIGILLLVLILVIGAWFWYNTRQEKAPKPLPVNTVIQDQEFHKTTFDHSEQGSFDMLIGGERIPLDEQDVDFYNQLISLYSQEAYPVLADMTQAAVRRTRAEDVTGRLFVSTQEKNGGMSVRSVDLKDGVAGEVVVALEGDQQISYSPDNKYYAVITPNAFNLENGQSIEVRDAQTDAKLFAVDSGYRESDVTWSQDGGKIAYHRTRTKEVGYEETESLRVAGNDIVVFDVESQKELLVIPRSARARWIHDDKYLLYFKSDGLYVYTMANGQEQKLVSVESDREMLLSSGLDVSFDNEFVVWTTGHIGSLDVLVLEKKDDKFKAFLGWRSYPQDREFYWPEFAPDSHHFAVQVVDKKTDDLYTRLNPRFDIYGIGSSTPYVSIPMSNIDFRNTFTDDWIKN